MTSAAQLDHVVINVRQEMDRGEALFAALGFSLTPRGYHTLGSINHLMLFQTVYLELIGMPTGGEVQRPEITSAPLGLTGLVFKTADVDATFAHLEKIGMAGEPPKAFSRPVEMPGGARDARFRTVTVRGDVFPAGRVYFCEHGTPELVWRPEWQDHANGARDIAEFVIVHDDPAAEAERYGQLLQTAPAVGEAPTVNVGAAELVILSPGQYAERYGDLCAETAGRAGIFGALVMRCADPAAIADRLATAPEELPHRAGGNGVAVRVPAFDSVLEFVG
ncbi:MAG: VOC family protein [Alphaproteobacteria bacterium]|nr:VOC family protein [Alphaproteobacteria bacterium]